MKDEIEHERVAHAAGKMQQIGQQTQVDGYLHIGQPVGLPPPPFRAKLPVQRDLQIVADGVVENEKERARIKRCCRQRHIQGISGGSDDNQ